MVLARRKRRRYAPPAFKQPPRVTAEQWTLYHQYVKEQHALLDLLPKELRMEIKNFPVDLTNIVEETYNAWQDYGLAHTLERLRLTALAIRTGKLKV